MNSKFNDKLDNLGTFFKGLKEDVILLQNDKDTSYNEEIASCRINSLFKLVNRLRHGKLLHRNSYRVWNLVP